MCVLKPDPKMVQVMLNGHNSYKFTEFANTDASALGEGRQHFNTMLGGHFKQLTPQQKNTKMWKMWH